MSDWSCSYHDLFQVILASKTTMTNEWSNYPLLLMLPRNQIRIVYLAVYTASCCLAEICFYNAEMESYNFTTTSGHVLLSVPFREPPTDTYVYDVSVLILERS